MRTPMKSLELGDSMLFRFDNLPIGKYFVVGQSSLYRFKEVVIDLENPK